MIATPASAERVQKCAFNFEIFRFIKNGQFTPSSPTKKKKYLGVTVEVLSLKKIVKVENLKQKVDYDIDSFRNLRSYHHLGIKSFFFHFYVGMQSEVSCQLSALPRYCRKH